MAPSDRPHRPHLPRGKWTAFVLAIAVNVIFLAVLIFTVSWQNRQPEAVTAELYVPPAKTVETPPPPEVKPPEPKPEPPPEPKPEPPPEPKPLPKPEPPPKAEKPPPTPADIAEKARQEAERKRKDQQERERKEREERERKEAEAKKQEEKKQAELKERQQRELAALRAQAEKEAQQIRQAQREAQLRAQAERESRERATLAAQAALSRAQADWIDKVRAKIRSNIILPSDLAGNPEAIFNVVQLPTGEVIDVQLKKSSGVRAYDDAVQRAILKASPLPKPAQAELFQRSLELRFRPYD